MCRYSLTILDTSRRVFAKGTGWQRGPAVERGDAGDLLQPYLWFYSLDFVDFKSTGLVYSSSI